MKLTNNRLYIDYNSTSPLATSVIEWISKGDVAFFANPSSPHSSGRLSRRLIEETREFLLSYFGLSKTHRLFFHSGATEGINTLLRGLLLSYPGYDLGYAISDHACVRETGKAMSAEGYHTKEFLTDSNGSIHYQACLAKVKGILSATFVNNETGVAIKLDDIAKFKDINPDILISIDAVQSIGKIADFAKLDPRIDAYTFSGHKFGAFKGIGFSIIKKDLELMPLLTGGGQESSLRSGTENVPGIGSLKLALQELDSKLNMDETYRARDFFESSIEELFKDRVEIVNKNASLRSSQTSCVVFKDDKIKIDIVRAALDMAEIDVGIGSACSSGTATSNRVLLAMGYKEEWAQRSLRFSFSPFTSLNDMKNYWMEIREVLKRF